MATTCTWRACRAAPAWRYSPSPTPFVTDLVHSLVHVTGTSGAAFLTETTQGVPRGALQVVNSLVWSHGIPLIEPDVPPVFTTLDGSLIASSEQGDPATCPWGTCAIHATALRPVGTLEDGLPPGHPGIDGGVDPSNYGLGTAYDFNAQLRDDGAPDIGPWESP